MRPPAPTANSMESVGICSARSAGAPAITVSAHVPPSFVLRQILPLSPTATTLKFRAATPRSGRAPRLPIVHDVPYVNECRNTPLSPTAHTSRPLREHRAFSPCAPAGRAHGSHASAAETASAAERGRRSGVRFMRTLGWRVSRLSGKAGDGLDLGQPDAVMN